jgi:antibiotic biosynthesis monooxygenase (ABM) superfamily enzyme
VLYRLVATGIYLFLMGLTLFLAFYPREIPLRVMWLVFSIFCQFVALMWYTLSYIPFARQIVINICQQTCCKDVCSSQVL